MRTSDQTTLPPVHLTPVQPRNNYLSRLLRALGVLERVDPEEAPSTTFVEEGA